MQTYREIFINIIKRHKNNNKWDSGEFIEMKKISNTDVGSVGQEFIENLCCLLELKYEFPTNSCQHRAAQSPWDIMIENITFEIKTATEDTSGKFQFNHIRYHRSYDAVLCLGVSPNDLFFNIWSKADIVTGKAGNLVSMEKGANASYKLTKSKENLFCIDSFKDEINRFIDNFN